MPGGTERSVETTGMDKLLQTHSNVFVMPVTSIADHQNDVSFGGEIPCVSVHSSHPCLAHLRGKSVEPFEWCGWKKTIFSAYVL